jgi:ankyrin repeat protein
MNKSNLKKVILIKTVFKEPDQQVKDESSGISSYASLEIVQLLLKAGLKANEKNNQGKTPLDLAKQKRDESSDQDLKSRYDAIVKYLEQAIASPSE